MLHSSQWQASLDQYCSLFVYAIIYMDRTLARLDVESISVLRPDACHCLTARRLIPKDFPRGYLLFVRKCYTASITMKTNPICENCPLKEECNIDLRVISPVEDIEKCREQLLGEYSLLFAEVCLAPAPKLEEVGRRKLQAAIRALRGAEDNGRDS